MPSRNHVATILLVIGALVSAAWAVTNVRAVEMTLQSEEHDFVGGTVVSIGLLELMEYGLPTLLGFWLAARVRNQSGLVRLLRRSHLLLTLTIVALVAVAMIGFFARDIDRLWLRVFDAASIASAVWLPVQVFFAAIFAGLWIKEREPVPH